MDGDEELELKGALIPANSKESALDALETPAGAREQLARWAVLNALESDPEEYAQALRIARRTGLPVQTVLNHPKEANQRDTLGIIDFRALENKSPELLTLLGSMDQAKLARDDIPTLIALAQNVKKLTGAFGGGVADSFGMAFSGASELLDISARAIDRPIRQLLGGEVADRFWYEPSRFDPLLAFARMGPDFKALGRQLAPSELERTFTTDVAAGLGQLTGQASLFFIPGGAATRASRLSSPSFNAPLANAALFAQGVDQVSELVREDISLQALKDLAAISGGAITVLSERFALEQILGPLTLPVKNRLLAGVTRIGGAALAEGGSETVESLAHDTLRQLLTNPDAPIQVSEALYEGGVGATVGGVARTIMEAALQIRVRAVGQERKALQAFEVEKTLGELHQEASDSKFLERSPELFERFMAKVAQEGNAALYLNADALMELGIHEQLMALSPSIAEQFEAAVQTGGQIAIPLEEYMARIAPTEYAAPLLDHLKVMPDGFNPMEAREYLQTQELAMAQAFNQLLQEGEQQEQLKHSAEAVQQELLEQLTATQRFTPQVSEAYATLVANYYATTAAKLNLEARALFERYPLYIQGSDVTQEPAQPAAHSTHNPNVSDQLFQKGDDQKSEEERDLIITHNLTEENLLHAQKLGGLPVPSLAISHKDNPLQNFGEITLVGSKELADPQGYAHTKVFGADIYSPRYPSISIEIDQKGFKRFLTEFAEVEALLEQWLPSQSELIYDTVRKLKDNVIIMAQFLRQNGIEPNIAYEESLQAEVARVSRYSTSLNIREQLQESGLSEAFNAYVEAQVAQISKSERIFMGYTPSGNRKYTPHNLENLVKLLKKNLRAGESFHYGVGSLRATLTSQFKSISAIKKSKNKLVDHATFAQLKEEINQELEAIAQALGTSSHTLMALLEEIPSKGVQRAAHSFKVELDEALAARVVNFINALKSLPTEYFEAKILRAVGVGEFSAAVVPEGLSEQALQFLISSGITQIKTYKRGDEADRAQQIRELEALFFQNRKGSFNPESLTLTLLEKADLSTFLHELGHLFLELQERLTAEMAYNTALTEGEQSFSADMQTILNWFEVESFEQWRGLTLEEKRGYHEQFARGFEAYLFEGSAPSLELQGVFQRFRAWLVNVYRSLLALNVNLSPEVRDVFDRMLASREQIEAAEQQREHAPLFESAEQAGLTAEEFAAYQALGGEATAKALEEFEAKGLRDMQWIQRSRSRVINALKKKSLTLRRQFKEEITQSVLSEPIYQAWDFLKRKEGGGKLSYEAVKALYPDYPDYSDQNQNKKNKLNLKRLSDHRMLSKAGGLHPDVVAELFGFSSGDELIQKLLEVPLPAQAIETLTDRRLLEEHGELFTKVALERAADQAIHNEVRAKMVAAEEEILAKATGRPSLLEGAAKTYAKAMVDRLKIRAIQPTQYTNAEVRAAKLALQAMKQGDLATAATYKRQQLLQHQAVRAAYQAQEEVERILRYLKSVQGASKTLDIDYREQIESLLERFDLRTSQTLKAIDKRYSLRQWLERQREFGLEPEISETLENEAYRLSYKNMPLEELRELAETIQQIEHLGHTKSRLHTQKRERDYETVKEALKEALIKSARGRSSDARTPMTNWGRAKAEMKRFGAMHLKVGAIMRVFDGGKDGGVWWDYFTRGANEAGDKEAAARAEATLELSQIISPLLTLGKMGGKGHYFASIERSLNKEALLSIALNTGNAGNLQRLLDGEGWHQTQLQPVLASLSAQEWQAVQKIWDFFEGYRPEIAAKERRIYGREPKWITPQPFTLHLAGGEVVHLKGGYYPIRYDPSANERAQSHADAEIAQRQMQAAYTTATTRRSFTKARAEKVKDRPLLYSLDTLYSGVSEVIHDLAWHEFLMDANRLMRSTTLDHAIRTTYGPEFKQQIKKWLEDMAQGELAFSKYGGEWVGRVRQNVTAAGLGFNLVSALIQPLGITQSIPRIGAQWVGRGIKIFLTHPIEAARVTQEKSSFMRLRTQTRFRELNELKNRVRGATRPLNFIHENAYVLLLRCQQLVDVPTWHGAYEKAIVEGRDEAGAVALADQAVIDSQGSGMVKDLAAIERDGGNWGKLFTVFYAYFNTSLNMAVTQTLTRTSRAKLAADYLILLTIPAVLDALLREALSFDDDDQEKDLEWWAKRLTGAQIDYLMGTVVGLRELAGAAKIVTGTAEFKTSYNGPTGVRLFADLQKLATQLNQAEYDLAFQKTLINLTGDLTGLPAAQINRTATGIQALIEEKSSNPLVIGFGFRQSKPD